MQAAFEALRQQTSETFLALVRDGTDQPIPPALAARFPGGMWLSESDHPLSWVDPTWHPAVHDAWVTATTSTDRVARTTLRTHRPLTTADGTVEAPTGWFELTLIDLTGVAGLGGLVALLRHLPAGPADVDTALIDTAIEVAAGADSVTSDPAWFRGTSNFRLRLDAKGSISGGTLNVAEVLGVPLPELMGTGVGRLIHPDDVNDAREAWYGFVGGTGTQTSRCRVRVASGRWRWFEVTGWNLIDSPGYGAIISEFRDIHELAEAEIESEATTRSLDRLLQMLDRIDDLVIVGRVGGGIMYLNTTASAALGQATAGQRLMDVLRPGTFDFVMTHILPAMTNAEQWTGDLAITVDDPEPSGDADRIFATTATPVVDGDVVYYGVIMHDVTEARRQSDALHSQARRDPLTGMPNRLALMEHLHAISERATAQSTVSVCFIDLDNLKVVNDGLGHSAGDQLLQAVGSALLHEQDDLVARFGGDEFVVVHVDDGPDDAARVAERVRSSISTVKVPGVATHVGASIGVATQEISDLDAERILRDADAAMYVAKRTGRSRVVHFDESMRSVAARRFMLENSLRQALAHDELDLHYQPVVSLESDQVVGFEALTRWSGAEPSEFIPVAEESGLIIPLGRWALSTALRTLTDLDGPLDGRDGLTIAVNVSAHQLFDPDFTGMVLDNLQACNVSPHRLVLELTESILIDPSEEVDSALRKLHQAGVLLALDDFGSGYSSIGYLRRYPISILKLDTGYTQNLDDRSTIIIAEAIVDMALRLGIEVIAEGVETEAQRATVVDMGITCAQGYLLGKAMPAIELPARLQAP